MAVIKVQASGEIPVKEVSGLGSAVFGGWHRLVAVADEAVAIFTAHSPQAVPVRLADWQRTDISGYPKPARTGSNFEGVAVDSDGQVVILAELPGRLVLVSVDGAATFAEIDLASVAAAVGKSFDDEFGFSGEGLVLLRDGHVLVAREKDPMGLLELAPPGSTPLGLEGGSLLPSDAAFPEKLAAEYTVAAWWPVEGDLEDISDLAVRDGVLWLLSDQSQAIASMPLDGPSPGTALMPEVIVDLGELKGVAPDDPEGLAFLDGRAVVAFDRKQVETNVAVIDIPLRRPSRSASGIMAHNAMITSSPKQGLGRHRRAHQGPVVEQRPRAPTSSGGSDVATAGGHGAPGNRLLRPCSAVGRCSPRQEDQPRRRPLALDRDSQPDPPPRLGAP
jgi:hypothetical protein